MEEKLSIAGAARAVTASAAEAGRVRLALDGALVDARVLASAEGWHAVEIEGRVETLFTVRAGASVWVWHRGRARLVERVADRTGTVAGATARPEGRAGPPGRGSTEPAPSLSKDSPRPVGSVTPPMPAVVVAVLVEPGQRVSRGDPLVVLSAMKTEMQLAAPVAGRVAAVTARVGARVRPGEVIVEIEPQAG
jgi:biotin carboxyl carrier protein